MTADWTRPPAENDLNVGGRGADLDDIAALFAQLAAGTPPVAPQPHGDYLPAMPPVPAGSNVSALPAMAHMPGTTLGRAGPSRPLPPSTGVNPFETMATPGGELVHLGGSGLAEGIDPSLMSLDLVPLRSIGRDLPSTQVPAPQRVARRAEMPGRHHGAVQSPGFAALPLGTVGPDMAAPSTALAGLPASTGSDYYFLPPAHGASAAPPATNERPGAPIRDDFPILRQRVNGHRLVWLDSAATTQKPAAVIDAEAEFYRRDNSNVHRGAHTLARRSTDAYEGARRKVQAFLGAGAPDEIVFVRGTTEGINLVAQSFGGQVVEEGDEILVTHLEHHSNIVPWQMLCQRKKARLRVVPVDDRGDIQLDAYAAMLGPRTRIVALTQVSNVLGTLLPIAPMAALAHQHGAFVVVDGAQSVAHLPVDVSCLGADFFVFSGHKLYAPTGIGALYGRKDLLEAMPPWQGGGSMIADVTFEHTTYAPPPAKFEAGTGHFAGAVGLGAAIDYLQSHGRENVAAHEQALIHYAEDALRGIPGLRLLGAPGVRIGALSFVLAGHEPTAVAQALDRLGIAVRSGHHCAQPILRRFGLEVSVRASLGIYSMQDDIDALTAALREIAANRTVSAPRPVERA